MKQSTQDKPTFGTVETIYLFLQIHGLQISQILFCPCGNSHGNRNGMKSEERCCCYRNSPRSHKNLMLVTKIYFILCILGSRALFTCGDEDLFAISRHKRTNINKFSDESLGRQLRASRFPLRCSASFVFFPFSLSNALSEDCSRLSLSVIPLRAKNKFQRLYFFSSHRAKGAARM